MRKPFNIYLLKGLDNEQVLQLKDSFSFVCSRLKLDTTVSIIDSLKVSLNPEDFLIITLDELSLNRLLFDQDVKLFFENQQYSNSQIIIILDDLKTENLPERYHYFPVFVFVSGVGFNEETGEAILASESTQSRMTQVVYDISQYISRINQPVEPLDITVFIGPSDDSTTDEFQKITRELVHRDFNLVPKISNPTAKELLENAEYLKQLLSETDLAIHFISHNSIEVFPEQVSPAMKINQIVADFCRTAEGSSLQRIVYVPDEGRGTKEILNRKIAQFKSDLHSLINAELVQMPVEKFKLVVLSKINELLNPIVVQTKEEQNNGLYFIYPPGCELHIEPYLTWLEQKKIVYQKSQIALDQLELLQYHQKMLTQCSGVIIYNDGNESWLARKLSDLKKSPGWGRKTLFQYKIICGHNPSGKEIKPYLDKSIQIIANGGTPDLKQLEKALIH